MVSCGLASKLNSKLITVLESTLIYAEKPCLFCPILGVLDRQHLTLSSHIFLVCASLLLCLEATPRRCGRVWRGDNTTIASFKKISARLVVEGLPYHRPRNSFFWWWQTFATKFKTRPGSKTNFVVAKLYVHFYAVVILGCVDDRITNITQKCFKLTIQ